MHRALARTGALGSLVVVLAAGCGGDEALSEAQYVSELNQMCEDFDERETQIGDPQTVADLVEKGPRILAAFDEAILDKVRTLKAPEKIAAQANRLVEIAELQHDAIRDLIDAANDSNLPRVQDLASKNAALNRESGSIARTLGAEACAGDS